MNHGFSKITFSISGSIFYSHQPTLKDPMIEKEVRMDGVEIHKEFINNTLVEEKTKIVNEKHYTDKEFL